MIIRPTKFEGLFIIDLEKCKDKRGFFARVWDKKQFNEFGLETKISQCSISVNRERGTLRGMHYQKKPHQEIKLIRCTKGSIFDVVVDLRKTSKTFKKWKGIELNEKNHRALYVPKGFAHGFITLQNNTEVFYQITHEHNPKYARGVLWNDPSFDIRWPIKPKKISKRDLSFPLFTNEL